MENLEIKIAKSLEALPEAKVIRRKVFIEEQGFVNEFDETDRIAYHAVVFSDNEPGATGRLFCDEKGWHIGRVAVLPGFRGCHLGEKVMKALEDLAKRKGVQEITLSAQVQASGFYEKLGYANLGDLHMDEHCPHVTMRKAL
ncbi:MAG: GNAT family N-acetyltransferase [Oscillospiraceae bacterium]